MERQNMTGGAALRDAREDMTLSGAASDKADKTETGTRDARKRKHLRTEAREERRRRRRYIFIMCVLIVELILAVFFFIARRLNSDPRVPQLTDDPDGLNGPPSVALDSPGVSDGGAESGAPDDDLNININNTASAPEENADNNIYGPAPRDITGGFSAVTVGFTKDITGWQELSSQYVVLLDAENGEIWTERESDVLMYPASMTKVLTLLVAAECIPEPENAWFTITREITNYCYVNGCSVAGFVVDETVTVRDLFYGCILPSGADAALGLAVYAYGSQENFVAAMNQKLSDLGLSGTARFTNCIGLFDENHYCTARDMAAIMRAALDDPICREVLTARTYQTTPTEQHPSGLTLSNWFIRRIEDRFQNTDVHVIGGKTGYVKESGNCAVSLARRESDGREFICVTGNAAGSWRAIADHTLLYQSFCEP